jgi:alkanesulfonate monooxygenase
MTGSHGTAPGDRLPFRTYSVLPSINDTGHHLRSNYRDSVRASARLAEEFGYTGSLLHYNFRGVDPWCLVPLVLESTTSLVPLVATPATAMPPHSLARWVAAMSALYARRVDINVVTGADPAELASICDTADHDERYSRAEDHVQCLRQILGGKATIDTPHWSYRELALHPEVPPSRRPAIFLAGSSPAGLRTAARIADVAVTHATDPSSPESKQFLTTVVGAGLAAGVRLGIIARPTSEAAWRAAQTRFPPDRQGAIATALKLRSDSHWVRSLAGEALHGGQHTGLWLGAFTAGRSHAAYLVGDYDAVGAALAKYRAAGVTRLLLDGPYDREEFAHTHEALRRLPPVPDGEDA